jgi:ADP-heptose:LPS heptosyltransferase
MEQGSPRILVIRRDNIGDLACTTPMLRALRARFPNAFLCALVNSYNAPLLTQNPDLDRVFHYTKAKHRPKGKTAIGVYLDRFRLFLEMRKLKFDYAIIAGAHFLPRALQLARAIKPQHIIGFTEPGKRGARHIDIAVPYSLPQPLHESEDIFRLLAPLGITGAPPPMQVVPDPAELKRAQAALAALPNLRTGTRVIGVHISARKPTNRWPTGRFIEMIRRLHEQEQATFMLFWSPGSAKNPMHPGDDEKAQAIIDGVGGIPLLPWNTAQLGELIGGLAACDVVVCSDGGAMHIAAALGKPIVCFFGSTDRTRWYPWGVTHVLLQNPERHVESITTAQALAAVAELKSLSAR